MNTDKLKMVAEECADIGMKYDLNPVELLMAISMFQSVTIKVIADTHGCEIKERLIDASIKALMEVREEME